ncbi:carboxymuconolactone decarboxylase family protein [Acidiferrimicrobium sp. IK]|uniref:carboxymuconolactone decarboxylase family protein n=1 Tax=Acidiferrimicrobium sp. IK TaxID=2871700 RepID=UPI0021CB6F19|nr:carboxymuconolactone decarboxylase family protein [Acidiferrimicrobium sp. IK]MCU4185518.1 carboxymuconolactone decarboxylase family protein [Acidiferrimicrobium sp. IK]
MSNYRQLVRDLAEPTRGLRDAIPEVWSGFAAMHHAAVAEGAVPARIKELTALAIAVVKQCDGCIAYHAKAAARAGATAEEVAEMLGVALLMDGGTASVYGPRAWQAYHEFSDQSPPQAHQPEAVPAPQAGRP